MYHFRLNYDRGEYDYKLIRKMKSLTHSIDTENLVQSIVETYDLSEKLKKRITAIAGIRIDELGISGFDNIYRYVDHLINKFQGYNDEISLLHLDNTPIDSRKSLHEIIADPNSSAEYIEFLEALSIEEVLPMLQEHLNGTSIDLIKQIMSQCDNNTLLFNQEEMFQNIQHVQHKLEELVSKYGRDGKLLIPRRPIVQVKFNPVNIRFGRRRYNGSPIDFFNEHRDFYKQFSRGQLYHFDKGLYGSLRKHKQLDLAIPEFNGELYTGRGGRQPLPEKERKKIIAAYDLYDRNVCEAARHLSYARETIARHWRKVGLKIFKNGRRALTEQQLKEVIDAYQTYNGKARVAARHLPYSNVTIGRYWEKAGLKVNKIENIEAIS